MRTAIYAALAVGVLATAPAVAVAETGYYEVVGVEAEDLLKMRAGPGIGYRVILGLPNGTILRVQSCEQTGSTRWCKVSLKQSRAIGGFVSWTYLRQN